MRDFDERAAGPVADHLSLRAASSEVPLKQRLAPKGAGGSRSDRRSATDRPDWPRQHRTIAQTVLHLHRALGPFVERIIAAHERSEGSRPP